MRGHHDIRQRRRPTRRREKISSPVGRGRRGEEDVAVVDDPGPSGSSRLASHVAELEVAEPKTESPGRCPLDPALSIVARCLRYVVDLIERVADGAKRETPLEANGFDRASQRVDRNLLPDARAQNRVREVKVIFCRLSAGWNRA